MHCERIEITQAHRPGGITPRRGFLLLSGRLACAVVVALCGSLWAFWLWVIQRHNNSVKNGCMRSCEPVKAHTLRRRPTFLPKKDFNRFFFKNPGRNTTRARCCGSFASSPPAHSKTDTTSGTPYTSHSKPQQITPARTPPPGVVRRATNTEKTGDFITHFQANFSDFPGLVLFRPV